MTVQRVPDFSPRRRAKALRMLQREWFRDANLTVSDRILYTLGLLVCDSEGGMRREDLETAQHDPVAVAYARSLLREAGLDGKQN